MLVLESFRTEPGASEIVLFPCGFVEELFCFAGVCCVKEGIATAIPAMIIAAAAATRISTVLFAMNCHSDGQIKEIPLIVQDPLQLFYFSNSSDLNLRCTRSGSVTTNSLPRVVSFA